MSTDSGVNLLDPGEDPHSNMSFLFFSTAIVKAVYDYQDLLRVSVAAAGNDHRLGANEAPPAIISIFTGEQLADVLNQLQNGGAKSSKKGGLLGLGVNVLPHFPKDAGDRNRTSPFAFTGNKFEFRAVGSSQSVSFPIVVLNTIAAAAIDEMTDALEAALNEGVDFEAALAKVLKDTLKAASSVIFNGDGYSDDWQKQAKKRGLLNLKTTMESLPYLSSKKNIDLFEKYHVLSEREVESRKEIMLEQYFKTINIEAETTEMMIRTMVIPGAVRYLNELVALSERGKSVGLTVDGSLNTAKEVNEALNALVESLNALSKQNAELGGDEVHEKANHMEKNVIPAMNNVRVYADKLEKLVADDYWPMPTYREMLFVR
jgi:glutamine synthetase